MVHRLTCFLDDGRWLLLISESATLSFIQFHATFKCSVITHQLAQGNECWGDSLDYIDSKFALAATSLPVWLGWSAPAKALIITGSLTLTYYQLQEQANGKTVLASESFLSILSSYLIHYTDIGEEGLIINSTISTELRPNQGLPMLDVLWQSQWSIQKVALMKTISASRFFDHTACRMSSLA
jgi:hypothetical protein